LSFERKFASKPKWVQDVHDELARWVLWSGGVAVVSQETALHGLLEKIRDLGLSIISVHERHQEEP